MRTTLKVLFIVAFVCASVAVEGQASWAGLSSLKAGQKIQIIEMTSKKHTGSFVSASDSAIMFTEGSAQKSLQKAEVRSVKLRTNRRLRNALIGLGSGAGVGAALGAATTSSDGIIGGRGFGAAVVGTAGAFVGAVTGLLIPTHGTVYSVESH